MNYFVLKNSFIRIYSKNLPFCHYSHSVKLMCENLLQGRRWHPKNIEFWVWYLGFPTDTKPKPKKKQNPEYHKNWYYIRFGKCKIRVRFSNRILIITSVQPIKSCLRKMFFQIFPHLDFRLVRLFRIYDVTVDFH